MMSTVAARAARTRARQPIPPLLSFVTLSSPAFHQQSDARNSALVLRKYSRSTNDHEPTTRSEEMVTTTTTSNTAREERGKTSPISSSSSSSSTTYIPTTPLGKSLLTLSSSLLLLNNPARGDLLSILTQVSSPPSLPHLLQLFNSTPSGRRLLIERPSINSETVDLDYLSNLPRGKLGREWVEWLKENNVGPDGRAEADYMATAEDKYLIQRYRESHDFYHLLLRMPITTLGETVVKFFEASQMRMPVAGLSAVGGSLRILSSSLLPSIKDLLNSNPSIPSTSSPAQDRDSQKDLILLNELIPWAVKLGVEAKPLITIEWEKRWEEDIEALRASYGITPPPVNVPPFKGRRGKKKMVGWPSKVLKARADRAAAKAKAAA
ncbi:Coq4-domain-containing protein [Violaceomyces palustris]|uniref:Coq4-domain-containing protein n=1 Tax=Violaceomyces palustris TaxID=1673888 RepID=A0ACD0NP12_9BASI|nr:Coq4-domain-containing protein [Violaceomyces palustris]